MSTRNRRSSKEKRARRRKRRRIAFLMLILLFFVMVYLGGCAYFKGHFLPNTKINGVKCDYISTERAYDRMTEHLLTYELQILSEEGELSVKAEEAGLTYEASNELEHILEEQQEMSWPIAFARAYAYNAMKTDVEKFLLQDTLDRLACMNPSTPRVSENASVLYDEEQKMFYAKDGAKGNQIDKTAFYREVAEAMCAGETTLDLATGECYLPGEFTKDSAEVVAAVEKANQYLGVSISIADGEKKLKVSKKALASFLTIDENYAVKFDKKVVEKYAKSKVGKKFNASKSMRILDTPGSGKVYIADGDGGKVVDPLAEAEELIKNIKAGKEVKRAPKYVSYYLNSSKGDIIKKDYIDINLTKQMVYVVLDGKIKKESPCVTGNVSAGRGTPTGIYQIAFKTTNYTMVKYQAFVYYWMPYDTSIGIGLHDATWRGQFGGNIYKYDGSHGCINLPLGNAAEIYKLVYKDLPVIVHY